jgi:hypothetical protein
LWLVTPTVNPENPLPKQQEFLVESTAIGPGIVLVTWVAAKWCDARMGPERRALLARSSGGAPFGVGALALIAI